MEKEQEVPVPKWLGFVARLFSGILLGGILGIIGAWYADQTLMIFGAILGFVLGFAGGERALGALWSAFWGG